VEATMHQAKTQLSKLVERVLAGDEVILTRGRKKVPAVRLVAIDPPQSNERPIGLYKGLIDIGPEFFEPLPEAELALWECGENDSTLLRPQ